MSILLPNLVDQVSQDVFTQMFSFVLLNELSSFNSYLIFLTSENTIHNLWDVFLLDIIDCDHLTLVLERYGLAEMLEQSEGERAF